LPTARDDATIGAMPAKDRTYQWNVVVDRTLDKAARAAAKEAGLPLAAWIRAVVRKQVGLPTL
jgi:hypothetical protein